MPVSARILPIPRSPTLPQDHPHRHRPLILPTPATQARTPHPTSTPVRSTLTVPVKPPHNHGLASPLGPIPSFLLPRRLPERPSLLNPPDPHHPSTRRNSQIRSPRRPRQRQRRRTLRRRRGRQGHGRVRRRREGEIQPRDDLARRARLVEPDDAVEEGEPFLERRGQEARLTFISALALSICRIVLFSFSFNFFCRTESGLRFRGRVRRGSGSGSGSGSGGRRRRRRRLEGQPRHPPRQAQRPVQIRLLGHETRSQDIIVVGVGVGVDISNRDPGGAAAGAGVVRRRRRATTPTRTRMPQRHGDDSALLGRGEDRDVQPGGVAHAIPLVALEADDAAVAQLLEVVEGDGGGGEAVEVAVPVVLVVVVVEPEGTGEAGVAAREEGGVGEPAGIEDLVFEDTPGEGFLAVVIVVVGVGIVVVVLVHQGRTMPLPIAIPVSIRLVQTLAPSPPPPLPLPQIPRAEHLHHTPVQIRAHDEDELAIRTESQSEDETGGFQGARGEGAGVEDGGAEVAAVLKEVLERRTFVVDAGEMAGAVDGADGGGAGGVPGGGGDDGVDGGWEVRNVVVGDL